jgi:hypothetical protein
LISALPWQIDIFHPLITAHFSLHAANPRDPIAAARESAKTYR